MYEMDKQFGELHAKVAIVNPGFKRLNDIKSKYTKPKISVENKRDVKINDLGIDPHGMAIEGMTAVVDHVILNGTTMFKDEYKDKTIKIEKDEDWNEIPPDVGEWISKWVMTNIFRTEEESSPDDAGSEGVEHEDNTV